jgi:hypothetical protein
MHMKSSPGAVRLLAAIAASIHQRAYEMVVLTRPICQPQTPLQPLYARMPAAMSASAAPM